MAKVSNLKKFKAIRERVEDLFRSHPNEIKKQHFIRVTAEVIAEMKWLCEEVSRLTTVAPPATETVIEEEVETQEVETE